MPDADEPLDRGRRRQPQRRQRRHHRFEQRQRQRHAGTAKKRPPRNVLFRHEHRGAPHQFVLTGRSPDLTRIWNCGLFTTAEHDRRKAVVLGGRVSRNRTDRRHVGVFHAAAERVGHHLLDEHPDKLRRIAQRARVRRPDRTRRRPDRRTAAPSHRSADRRRRPDCARQLPSASKFSSANPIGSMILWQPAHGGLPRCSVICSRSVSTLPPSALVSSSGGTLGGGSGGGVPRMFSSTHTPRFTGERAEVLRPRHREETPLAEQAAAIVELRRQRHAPELRAVDIRDAVVSRQPLVDERVVRGQQIDDVAILADDAVEEQLGLALQALAQLVVPVRIEDAVGRRRRQVAQIQQLLAEVGDQRVRARIARASGAPAARAPRAGSAGPAPAAAISSSSGMLLQRKNDSRDASSRSVMR